MTTPFDVDNSIKQNIFLKSTSTDFNNLPTDNVSFTIELNEPFKNVIAIKHVKTYVELSNVPTEFDMINVKINDFDLIDSYDFQEVTERIRYINTDTKVEETQETQKKKTNLIDKYFISIPTSDNTVVSLNNDGFSNVKGDPQCYHTNPMINHLKNIKVEIFKSDGSYYTYEDIKKIFIELCIFSSFKKITQF